MGIGRRVAWRDVWIGSVWENSLMLLSFFEQSVLTLHYARANNQVR